MVLARQLLKSRAVGVSAGQRASAGCLPEFLGSDLSGDARRAGEDGSGPEYAALLAGDIGLAQMAALDALAPAERPAFVLHDMVAVPYGQIADVVARTPAALMQLAGRGSWRPPPSWPSRRTSPRQDPVLSLALSGVSAGQPAWVWHRTRHEKSLIRSSSVLHGGARCFGNGGRSGGRVGMMRKRSRGGGPGRTVIVIGLLVAGGVTGLAALQSSLGSAPPQLPGQVEVARGGQPGVGAVAAGTARGSRPDGERPESREQVQIVTPRHAVIVVPATRTPGDG